MKIKKQIIWVILASFLLNFTSPLLTVLADELDGRSDEIVLSKEMENIESDYFDNTESIDAVDSVLSNNEITVLNERVSLTENAIIIDGKSYNQEEFDELLNSTIIIQPRFAAAAGVYFIPGVGQVALTATGAVVLAGATIYAGHWAWNKISDYLNAPKWSVAQTYGIDHGLLTYWGNVDLGKFKDKHGNTPLNKNSGTFKNGRYEVEKDTAKHGGRKWKLKKN